MSNNGSWEHLKILTKSEIIEFLKRENYYDQPKKGTVKFFKWNTEAMRLQKQMDDHIENKEINVWCKERDSLAKKFNSRTDISIDIPEKIRLADKINDYDKKIRKHHDNWDLINKKMKKNDLFLDRK